jgi:hypothetical protein
MSDINTLKRDRRAKAIDELVAAATKRGDCTDRLYWTLTYDFEHAPMTTNLQQLAELGFHPVSLENHIDAAALQLALDALVDAMAQQGIYLTRTNHLTNQELYKRLVTIVLVEPVRDLPTDAGVSEFIDLQGCEPAEAFVDVCDRDAALPRPTTASTVAG